MQRILGGIQEDLLVSNAQSFLAPAPSTTVTGLTHRKYSMQTHIVVPLDGSSFAETILPHATALARATSARVTLLRVIPPVTSLGLMGVELPGECCKRLP